MAKLGNNFQFTGKLGNISAYTMHGVDGVILRTKGGASAKKIKTHPAFANTRRYNAEFGGASKAAGKIGDAVYLLKHLADHNIAATLTKLAKKIQHFDASGELGRRGVYISRHKEWLEGFSFNKKTNFDTVTRHSLTCSVTRDTLSAVIELPSLLPGINFYIPGRYPLFRYITVLSIVPDMVYASSGYEPATTQRFELDATTVYTNWNPTAAIIPAQTLTLQLLHTPVLEDMVSLVVSVGIEFGMPAANNEITPIQRAGCAKILAVR